MKKKDIFVIVGVVLFFIIALFFVSKGDFFLSHKEVGIVRITGTIANSEPIVNWLDDLSRNSNIKGLFIYINSPGGSAVASDEIYRAIKRFKEKRKAPVVAYISQVGASGGYYVACAADKIVVNPASITGSIGVIAEFPEFSELLKKVGVQMRVIKSGKNKDIGSPFREMTPKEKEIIEKLIDETYSRFVGIVSEARGIPEERVRTLADGRIYSGEDAVKLGLCDTLGDFITAKELMKRMLKVPKIKIVEMKKPFSIKDFVLKSKLPYGMILSYRMIP